MSGWSVGLLGLDWVRGKKLDAGATTWLAIIKGLPSPLCLCFGPNALYFHFRNDFRWYQKTPIHKDQCESGVDQVMQDLLDPTMMRWSKLENWNQLIFFYVTSQSIGFHFSALKRSFMYASSSLRLGNSGPFFKKRGVFFFFQRRKLILQRTRSLFYPRNKKKMSASQIFNMTCGGR